MRNINLFLLFGISLILFVASLSSCSVSTTDDDGLTDKPSAFKFVPKDYETTVRTGGEIESKYICHGSYPVARLEHEVEDDFKRIVIYYPSNIQEIRGKLPVVVFVNGTGVKASTYVTLFKHLCSWGFIVVGNEEPESWDGVASDKSLAYLLSLDQTPESPLFGKVDRENIGASGHSQGGAGVFNTITAQKHSSMYKTAVSLSPTQEEMAAALKWSYDLTKIDVPLLMMAGTEGDFETNLVLPLDKMNIMYEKIQSPKVMMRRKGAEHGHMLYSGDGYVTAWMMWQLKNDEYAARAFTGDDPEILSNPLYQDQRIDL